MRNHIIILYLTLFATLQTAAQTTADSTAITAAADTVAVDLIAAGDSIAVDSTAAHSIIQAVSIDSAPITVEPVKKNKSFFGKVSGFVTKVIDWFSEVDTMYVEPQKYNFEAMVQNTNTYERYEIRSAKGNVFSFSPEPKIKFGPYFGWRFLFLGYTIDYAHFGSKSKSTEFDLSLYTAPLGIDLFYRKTGSNYKIKYARFESDKTVNTRPLKGVGFDGINVSIIGLNVYYIFNNRKFSYPAAFSQSTIQRRSCGSWLCGIGYTKHSLKLDWEKLYNTVSERLGEDVAHKNMDSQLKMSEIKYTDLSISCGYGYNWAFARNWLAAASLSLAAGYKNSTGNDNKDALSFRNFSIDNFNIDGVCRLGLVWNNMRWYAGMSTIMHTYNYSRKHFSTNSIFGSINIYFGLNFSKKKQYR